MNETFNVAPGGFVESYQPRNKINMIYGVWVDNFSGGWLNIDGHNLWIPPYTRGWKASIFPGMSTITIRSYDFARGAIITGATGQSAVVTLWDEDKGDSEGTEFFDQQTIPLVLETIEPYPHVFPFVTTLIAAPAVGRIRLYQVKLSYLISPMINTSNASNGQILSSIGGIYLADLTINPAKSTNEIVITPPGGDLPIGAAVVSKMAQEGGDDPPAIWTIRYAVL